MVIENPFVTRDDLRDALDPSGHSPSRAVRRLREAGLISRGIELRLHEHGRLQGGTVYYCALNLDAVEAVRDGDKTAARKLAQAAAVLESTKAARSLAKALVSAHAVSDLQAEDRRAASTLAARITQLRDRLELGVNPLVGLVISTDDRYGTVRTADETIVLARETLQARGLDWPGAAVAIRVSNFRTGAMLHSVDEALAIEESERRNVRPFDPFAMRAARRGEDADAVLEEALAGRQPIRLLVPLALAR